MERLIRRYENRKLYDTVEKRYASLAEMARWVREGHEIRVVEAPSGEDVTARTLTQIVIEQERSGQGPLPSGLLHDLIRWGGKVVTLTVDQMEHQLDRLIRASLQRLEPVHQAQEDMRRVEERIGRLEAAVAALSEARGRRRRSPRRRARPKKEVRS